MKAAALAHGEHRSRTARALRWVVAAVAPIFQKAHLVGRISAVRNVLGGRLGHRACRRGLPGRFVEPDPSLPNL